MGLRLVVAVVDIDPAIALLCDFSFPEWCTGFEVVHNELGGIEGHAAMCASHPQRKPFHLWDIWRQYGGSAKYAVETNANGLLLCLNIVLTVTVS